MSTAKPPTTRKILQILANRGDRAMALGLATLICLAQRERTSIAYQHKEMNFTDVSFRLVSACDELSDADQLDLVADIAVDFMSNNHTAGAIAQ